MAWVKKAETDTKQHLYDQWKLEIYQEGGVGDVLDIKLASDLRLKRGSAGSKSKFERILHTTVELEIIDDGNVIADLLNTDDEYQFMGVIKKNGSEFYKGYITLLLDKIKYKRTNNVIRLRLYDGLKRLEEFKDLNDIGNGIIQLKEIVRTIFNALNLKMNIHAYEDIYSGVDEDVTDPKALWLQYIKTEDLMNTLGRNTSYYTALETLAKMFDWNVFQENAVWVLRQNGSVDHTTVVGTDGVFKEVITYSSGTYATPVKTDLDKAIANTDLIGEPVKIRTKKIDRVEIEINCYSPADVPQISEELEPLTWVNPFFKENNNGWTTASGSPDYRDESIYMLNGAEVYQTSGNLLALETVSIQLSATSIRMVLDVGDALTYRTDNPLFRIVYIGSSNTYYWEEYTGQVWSTTFDIASILGVAMKGVRIPGPTYLEIYDRQTLEFDREIVLPNEDGNLKIICYGGGVASGNNYPFEQDAITNFAIVRKVIEKTTDLSTPDKLVLRSEIASAKDEIKYSLPFADYNPYTGVCIWGREKTTSPAVDTYNRVNKWEPDGLLLTESIAGRTIRLNRDERGYEINLKPGTDLSFINLVEADFEMEGWDTYHLPVYEEALLIEDHRRFILIDHNVSDSAITHKSEFVFPDSPQQ